MLQQEYLKLLETHYKQYGMNLNKFDNVHKELNVVAKLLEEIKGTHESI